MSTLLFFTVLTENLGPRVSLGGKILKHPSSIHVDMEHVDISLVFILYLYFDFQYAVECYVFKYIGQYCKVRFFFMTFRNVLTQNNENTTLTGGRSPIF